MNDDLKAYVDGELPPDAAERLRAALAGDPALRREADAIRDLSAALRRLPEPDAVGQASTLAALGRRRPSLVRGWGLALAGCAAVLAVSSGLAHRDFGPRVIPAELKEKAVAAPVEAAIPNVRREAFVRYVRDLGGMVRRDGDGLRAFYPEASHEGVVRRFLLPEDLPWPADGLRVRFDR